MEQVVVRIYGDGRDYGARRGPISAFYCLLNTYAFAKGCIGASHLFEYEETTETADQQK